MMIKESKVKSITEVSMKVTSDLQVVFLTLDFLKSAFTPWAMLTLLEINVSTEVVFVFVQQYRSHTDLT